MKDIEQKARLACQYKKASYLSHVDNDDSTITITAVINVRLSYKDLEDYAETQTRINIGGSANKGK